MTNRVTIAAIVFFHAASFFLSREASSQLTQQGSKLVSAGAAGTIDQGYTISVSADGNTAVVGGPGDHGGAGGDGAAWIWVRSGGVWTQSPKLVGTGVGSGTGSQQGWSVAISADGNTVLVGGPFDDFFQGAVWVWTRSGNTWSQQGLKLVGTGTSSSSSQGWSVALSADGNTAIVGAYGDNGGIGAALIWTRSGGTWTQQGPKLVGTGAIGQAQQGKSVALSVDGNTAIVGGFDDNGGLGAAWVWTRSGGTWTQQGSKLVGTGNTGGGAAQGGSVALSADGNTALVGGAGDNAGIGATWVWTRSGGVWTQQGNKLVGTGATGIALQGSVALSNDGNTALIGGWVDNSFQGAVWVWSRSGSTWTQQGAKLVGTGASANSEQGYSVALSGDGNTALASGPFDDGAVGAFWVWTRSGSLWTQQGPKLVGSGGIPSAQQGSAVAISADGNTAIVGGPGDSGNLGAAWIWTRNGSWTEQAKLAGTGAFLTFQDLFIFTARQGSALALSADGNTAIVGGPYDSFSRGAAWIWTRSGTTWTQQGPKLVGSGAANFDEEGSSVALSADGNTAIVGAPGDNSNQGAAWVWTRSGGTWTQQGLKLVGTGAIGSANQGASVALSADGNTALIGGPFDNGANGAAWVWTRNGATWTQQGNKLVGAGAAGSTGQGTSIGISADGNTALVGGPSDGGGVGAVWVWTRNGGNWTQQGTKLVGTGAVGNSGQGSSVALSADGNEAIVGGDEDESQGAAWVWTRSAGAWTQQGNKLVGTGATGFASQGSSVALSGDASTALVGGPRDNHDQGAAWVFTTIADLRISETVSPSIQAILGQVTYTIIVTNGGPSPASNVTVTDSIPAGSTLVSVTPSQGTCSGVTMITCSAGSLANGSTMTITLVLTAPGGPTTLTNTASVSGAGPDPTPADNTASASIPILQTIPTLSTALLALLALLLGAVGVTVVRVSP